MNRDLPLREGEHRGLHRIHVDAHRHLHHPADEAPGERSRADAKARQGDAKSVKKARARARVSVSVWAIGCGP